MQIRTVKTVGAIVITALSMAVITGCTAPMPGKPASPSPSPTAIAALPSGVVQPKSVPANVANDPKIRHNVSIQDCSKADGGWKAAGIAENTGKSAVTYLVTVFFTTDHATVLASAATKVQVAPGQTGKWSVHPKFTPTPKMLCVLRGVATK